MATKRKKRTVPVITTMRLPPDVIEKVDARADAEGISRTQIVIGLIRRHCKRPRTPPAEAPADAAPSVFD